MNVRTKRKNETAAAPVRLKRSAKPSAVRSNGHRGDHQRNGVRRSGRRLSYRGRELNFCRDHPEAFSGLEGEWVALEGETIVAHAKELDSVVAAARSRGIKVPFVFKVAAKLGENEGWLGI